RGAKETEPLPLELVILPASDGKGPSALLARYGSARVLAPFDTKGGAAGERMRRIIAAHEGIAGNLLGKASRATLPTDDELLVLGAALFETLFPGDARRLYDEARSRAAGRPFDLVLTCAVDWLAAKPWEFAFDPARRTFLATEELRFVRQ